MKHKTAWEIREWVEEAIPLERQDYIGWSEAHYDKFGKEWDELHDRESVLWVQVDDLKRAIEKGKILCRKDNNDDVNKGHVEMLELFENLKFFTEGEEE